MMLRTGSTIMGNVWHGLTEDNNYQVRHAPMRVEVERSGVDEVAIQCFEQGSDSADVSVYLPDDQAIRLMALLGSAVVEDRP